MTTDEEKAARVREAGRWEGMTFHFDPPITVPGEYGPRYLPKVDVTDAVAAFGVDKDELILAILHPVEGAYARELREIAQGR